MANFVVLHLEKAKGADTKISAILNALSSLAMWTKVVYTSTES